MFSAFQWAMLVVPMVLLLLMLGAWLYGYCWPENVPLEAPRSPNAFRPIFGPDEVAVLIACRNGAGSIGAAIRTGRRNGCEVYVVSDASTDDTAQVARSAGAIVLALDVNVGKPAALWTAYETFPARQSLHGNHDPG